jgi:hypothetical protein
LDCAQDSAVKKSRKTINRRIVISGRWSGVAQLATDH